MNPNFFKLRKGIALAAVVCAFVLLGPAVQVGAFFTSVVIIHVPDGESDSSKMYVTLANDSPNALNLNPGYTDSIDLTVTNSENGKVSSSNEVVQLNVSALLTDVDGLVIPGGEDYVTFSFGGSQTGGNTEGAYILGTYKADGYAYDDTPYVFLPGGQYSSSSLRLYVSFDADAPASLVGSRIEVSVEAVASLTSSENVWSDVFSFPREQNVFFDLLPSSGAAYSFEPHAGSYQDDGIAAVLAHEFSSKSR